MAKKAYRVRNWRQYNEALVQRGSITLWLNEKVIRDWYVKNSLRGRGRPKKYSDVAIECGLTIKAVFNLTFRAVEGFITSLLHQWKINAKTPDYSLLCKRQKTLKIKLRKSATNPGEGIHILVDTTGLKVFGEGEWKVRQHGYIKKRLWRKLHVAINADNQEIEAFELKELTFQDGDGLPLLIKQINKEIASATGDGAYDQYKAYKLANEQSFRLITPPNRVAKLMKECTGNTTKAKHTADMRKALQSRDAYIERIRQIGRPTWKEEVGYHRRSLVETAMFRVKMLLGNRLSTRKFAHQKIEAAIWCNVINQMTQLGMPISEISH